MDEIAPGLLHWTAFHEGIGTDVHSHFHLPSATLFDPLEPPEGLHGLPRDPERIVMSNRHHWRHIPRFRDEFGIPVLCHEAGLYDLPEGVEGYAWGDEIAPGVTAHEVGVLCPEETALEIDDALLFADSIVRGRGGQLAFVPDGLLGDDPQAIRDGLRARFRALADEVDFDVLLMAHGAPLASGGRDALRAFAGARNGSGTT
jgi:hypothetical protein